MRVQSLDDSSIPQIYTYRQAACTEYCSLLSVSVLEYEPADGVDYLQIITRAFHVQHVASRITGWGGVRNGSRIVLVSIFRTLECL